MKTYSLEGRDRRRRKCGGSVQASVVWGERRMNYITVHYSTLQYMAYIALHALQHYNITTLQHTTYNIQRVCTHVLQLQLQLQLQYNTTMRCLGVGIHLGFSADNGLASISRLAG
jgi:hypothetical protein